MENPTSNTIVSLNDVKAALDHMVETTVRDVFKVPLEDAGSMFDDITLDVFRSVDRSKPASVSAIYGQVVTQVMKHPLHWSIVLYLALQSLHDAIHDAAEERRIELVD